MTAHESLVEAGAFEDQPSGHEEPLTRINLHEEPWSKLMTGHAPGLDLVIYGAVLVLVVAFAPRGIAGLFDGLRAQFRSKPAERRHG